MIRTKSRPSPTAVGNTLLGAAGLMMLLSIFYDGIDLAGGDYRVALLTAIVLMAVADVLCVHQFICRRGAARWIAAAIAVPSVFVISDVIRRAPYVWHLAN